MYTTNCPNCNFEVTNQQPQCPRCGMSLTSNAPVGQPQNYPSQTGNQMQFTPSGPPGTAPATAGGAENNNPGAGKLHMILIGIIGIIAILALVFAIIGNLSGTADVEEDDDDSISIKDFSVENFEQTSEIRELSDSTTVTWRGEGDITISDKKNSFYVVIKKALASGGNDTSTEVVYQVVVVHNGVGNFTTYLYGNVEVTTEPVYDFELLGFTQLIK